MSFSFSYEIKMVTKCTIMTSSISYLTQIKITHITHTFKKMYWSLKF